MFDIPEAKRVRRSELHSDYSRSPSPSYGDKDAVGRHDQAAQAALASFFSSRFDMSKQPAASEPNESKGKSSTTQSSANAKKEKETKKRTDKQQRKSAENGISLGDSHASTSSGSDEEMNESASSGADAGTDTTTKPDASSQAAPEYAFRLFAAPTSFTTALQSSTSTAPDDAATTAGPAIQKITLDPSITADDPFASKSRRDGGLIAARPRSHYIAEPWSAAQRASCAAITYTPEMLAAEAARPWAGCTKPWRVTRVIRVSKKTNAKLDRWGSTNVGTSNVKPDKGPTTGNQTEPGAHIEATLLSADGTPLTDRAVNGVIVRKGRAKGGRPGKKRRLVWRKRARERVEAKEAERAAEEERAREKTRKNREKKVRRKMKLKEKEKDKAGETEGNGGEESAVAEGEAEA